MAGNAGLTPLFSGRTRGLRASPKVSPRVQTTFPICDHFCLDRFILLSPFTLTFVTLWQEHVVEHVIAHAPAQDDAFRLVEFPVDAEIDAALAVLLLRLRERRETARDQRSYVAFAVPRNSVEFVRNKSKGDVVGAIEPAQRLEQGGAKTGVPGRIGWEGGRKVWSREVAAGSTQRRPARVSDRVGIGIAGACRTGAGIRLAAADTRSPHRVVG